MQSDTQPSPRPEPQPTSNPAGKTGWSFSRLFDLEKRLVVSGTALCGLIAATVTVAANLDNLQARYDKWQRNWQYEKTLRRPYPKILKEDEIANWNSGRLNLALFQIDGYLGRLKTAPRWIKTCLTSRDVFPQDYESQYNDRLDLDENSVDKANKDLLQRRIDKIATDKVEDADIFRTPDLFARLLKRSAVQLLSAYKDSDLSLLDKPELYLLRNAIYGRYGFDFSTPKLRKFANRRGWGAAAATFNIDKISQVESCNAFFLEEMYPLRELGALGRGVLVRQTDSPGFTPWLKPALCACLAARKSAVDCHESSLDPRDVYRDFVDLVMHFDVGDAARIDWTFLDSRYVEPPDLEAFKANQSRFISAAADFNAAVHKVFRSRNFSPAVSQEVRRGAYWGVKLTFSKDVLQQFANDSMFLKETADAVCQQVRDGLELTGPLTPRTVSLTATQIDSTQPPLEIYKKPIDYSDLRIKLTLDYIIQHYGASGPSIELRPSLIAIDWTDTATLDEAYDKYQPAVLPGSKKPGIFPDGEPNYSAHYLIDRDGTIFNLMNDVFIARHLVGLDRQALVIGNVGSAEAPPTPAQAQATAQLVRFLQKKFGSISYLIGASEYKRFIGSPLWEEKDARVKPEPAGPGGAFLAQLRDRLKDTKLKSEP